ncbi:MAG: hypothetical protein KKG09_07715 [Verrucomicrobia bacterium]|nr:hypothetical protein [Verrucomicrobiota bacterium]MCG2679405.1 hypothetical protein [Kiritimatiellia bacterium]MBU4247609.1 hypothetical protein [Verrucomicrobiota bacterium]MBU4289866.1 hypothetical protein [Verrucomicrobiota bacterium]MBU4428786.1 hypothetical protein [Verrucomicrobiota bacterium]
MSAQFSVSDLNAFRAELMSVVAAVAAIKTITVRDEDLRERFRTLFRVWSSSIETSIRDVCRDKKDILKIKAELEKIAQLASRIKTVSEYRKRLNRAISLINGIAIYLPSAPSRKIAPSIPRDMFLSGIPDVSVALVPNSIVGWKSRMQVFLDDHPFDQSVFIMIRYRKRNDRLIQVIKSILKENGEYGVLANEHKLTDDLYNPIACLLCCSRGIAVFDRPEKHENFNPNVAYELGMLHLLGRPCLILKHSSFITLQTDILMKVYEPYTTSNDAGEIIGKWGGEGQTEKRENSG